MRGFIYYAKEDAEKNVLFIEDVIHEASKIEISLDLITNKEHLTEKADFIIFRNRDWQLCQQLESTGIRIFNRSEVNRIANHKLRTCELAALLGIPTVPTKKLSSIEQVQSFPVVIKTVDGHGGDEVFLVNTIEEANEVLHQFSNRELIVQPYVETNAQDVRVFIIGQEVVGAVKRTGNDSFKSNFTLGGTIEKFELSSQQEKEALTIAKAIKSDYIGIDFLLLPDDRWLLNEIEDPVGARSLYKTHNFSVAAKLMIYIKEQLSNKSSTQKPPS